MRIQNRIPKKLVPTRKSPPGHTCHSERSEELQHFVSACACAFTVIPPPKTWVPLHRAFLSMGGNVDSHPAAKPLPLLLSVLSYPTLGIVIRNRHFDRSCSRLLRAAQWRNPLLYLHLSQAQTASSKSHQAVAFALVCSLLPDPEIVIFTEAARVFCEQRSGEIRFSTSIFPKTKPRLGLPTTLGPKYADTTFAEPPSRLQPSIQRI